MERVRKASRRYDDDTPTPAPSEPPRKLTLTCREAAGILGMSEYKVRHLARAQAIPHYQVGSRIYIDARGLERWQKQGGGDTRPANEGLAEALRLWREANALLGKGLELMVEASRKGEW